MLAVANHAFLEFALHLESSLRLEK